MAKENTVKLIVLTGCCGGGDISKRCIKPSRALHSAVIPILVKVVKDHIPVVPSGVEAWIEPPDFIKAFVGARDNLVRLCKV